MEVVFAAELWEWQGKGTWCFLSLPKEYYLDLKTICSTPKRGFGSLRVEVRIGSTTWKTSIFPDSKSKTYILPIKKDVRNRESIGVGDYCSVSLRLFDV